MLTSVFRSNTHTCAETYRTPPMSTFRNEKCKCTSCSAQMLEKTIDKEADHDRNLKKLAKSAQRAAQRQAAYIGGYCSKVQRISRFYLHLASDAMRSLAETVQERSPLRMLIAVSNRLLNDLEVKGISRTITEEYNLAIHADSQTPVDGEFIRTFHQAPLHGQRFYTARREVT